MSWPLQADLADPTRRQASCEELGLTHLGQRRCAITSYHIDGQESGRAVYDPVMDFYLPLHVRDLTPASGAIQETQGQVIIRATDFQTRAQGVHGHTWESFTAHGVTGMQAWPFTNTNLDAPFLNLAPRISYQIHVTGGEYYVWVHGYADTVGDDSVHVGVDGLDPGTASHIDGFTPLHAWRWSSHRRNNLGTATLTLTPGPHRLDVWMREDGFAFSGIVLTHDSVYDPNLH